MTRIITLITFFIVSVVTAQAQYEKGMQQALELWKNDKPTEAIAVFERIAAVDETNWLPNYYIAFINTVQSFRYMNDKVKVKALLEEAQKAQDKMNRVALDNPEVLVMQAMIHTGWIVYDPMVNGQKLSGDVMYIYNKAYQIAPENPRVVFQKASFEIGMASYFGQDTKPMCAQLEKSIELFANFKPETPFHPTWGLDRAQEELAKCKK
ncbi:MAG: hypothetical protein CMP76_13475 [Flavobacterium sp.]|uniref:hypothetical protein n=1 Tax=Flavobacterium sp. TaxID=239 RepID=UPI000C3F9925|nr:hypothetical protein [Flavobacterium sp.]MBF04295.1 hypothetical protein [Flavobacterium sp.]|tara:strand:+ start:947 stop:1573 length:627 start_codon:yes stop_codon:yes gene_type:complete